MSFVEWTEVVRNLALAIAAPIGAYIAWRGLDDWKEERNFEADHDLALEIFRGFRFRKEIYNYIRSPAASPPTVADRETSEKLRNARIKGNEVEEKFLYWAALRDTEIRQKQLFDEAALRWALDFHGLSEPIRDLEHELACGLDDIRASVDGKFDPGTEAQKNIDAITSAHRDPDDRKAKYEKCFREIENTLKPRIIGRRLRKASPQ